MYERLIIDAGPLSTPQCPLGTGWISVELWLRLTVMYCCWVRSTWKRMSWSTFKWIWEAGATGVANSISLHQAQLCLNIFSKWKGAVLKGAVLGIFRNWCRLSYAEGWAFQFIREWQDYFEDGGVRGKKGKGEFHRMLWVGVGRRYPPPCLSLGGGLQPAEERTLLISISSHVAGQLDDRGEGGCFPFSRTHWKSMNSDLSPFIENLLWCKVAMNGWSSLILLPKLNDFLATGLALLGPGKSTGMLSTASILAPNRKHLQTAFLMTGYFSVLATLALQSLLGEDLERLRTEASVRFKGSSTILKWVLV